MRLFAVRGAIRCENTRESISRNVALLYRTILERNAMREGDIVSVQFTMTGDLHALNPATALRLAGLAAAVPLFCSAEPVIDGALNFVIRVLVTFYGEKSPTHVYLNGAEVLRPDFSPSKDQEPPKS